MPTPRDAVASKNLENFLKIFEPKVFNDISQSAAPSKHHISYEESFKKFAGGGGGVVCLIIVSLQVHSFENLTLNFEFLSSDLNLDHGLDTGP